MHSLPVRLLQQRQSAFQRYVVALLIVSASIWITLQLDRHHLGHLFSLNLAATVVATMYGGLGPGLIAGGVGALGMDYYFVEPRHSVEFGNPLNILRISLYSAVAFLISLLVDSLRKAYTDAERNRQAREELLSILAHDLRAPIAGIQLTAQVLTKAAESTDKIKIMEFSESIVQTTRRLNQLVCDVLDATRVESGRISLSRSDHDASDLMRDVINDFQPIAEERNIQLKCLSSLGMGMINCDRGKILQVLSNLVGNALKFTPENGTVTVAVEHVGDKWKFSVIDSGSGIPSAHLPQIFEKHWQPKEHRGQGIGLGLYIARGIVEAHGGSIWAESDAGTGASFFFLLP